MKKIFILLALPFLLVAGNLELVSGKIKAHTEVMGDTTIDPSTTKISTKLTMAKSITSIKGKVYINAKSLVSDNSSRDKNMYKTLKVANFKTISYTISSIKAGTNGKYRLIGKLNFAGKTKALSLNASITKKSSNISLKSNFSIKLTNYGLTPPKILFLSVRDKIDINIELQLKIR